MKIRLDGKEVELKPLNLNDLIELEKRFGDIREFSKKKTLSLEETRTLIWLLIRKSDSAITEERIGELLVPTDKSFDEIMQSVNKAIVLGGGLNPNP